MNRLELESVVAAILLAGQVDFNGTITEPAPGTIREAVSKARFLVNIAATQGESKGNG